MLSLNFSGSQDTVYELQNTATTSRDELLDKLPSRPEPIYIPSTTGGARVGSRYATISVSSLLAARNKKHILTV